MFGSGENCVLAIRQESSTMNEIHLFPVYDHGIHLLSPSLECFRLSIMFILSLICTYPICLLLLFDFLYHLVQNFCIACLLFACLLAFSHLCRHSVRVIALACFPILFSLLFLFYCFGLFLLFASHYSSFSHQFSLPVFPLFEYFLLW